MRAVLLALAASLRAGFLLRITLQLEVLSLLRHQLAVYRRRGTRPRINSGELRPSAFWTVSSPRRGGAGWSPPLFRSKPSATVTSSQTVGPELIDDLEGVADNGTGPGRGHGRQLAESCTARMRAGCRPLVQPGARARYLRSTLNACTQSFFRNPGMHQSMHRGSMARAASARPASSTSQPNSTTRPAT